MLRNLKFDSLSAARFVLCLCSYVLGQELCLFQRVLLVPHQDIIPESPASDHTHSLDFCVQYVVAKQLIIIPVDAVINS